jgi:hypothetical protein
MWSELMDDLTFDLSRLDLDNTTGIYIRGKLGGSWENHDIACLTRDSLLAWMIAKDQGREGLYSRNVVLALLDHNQSEEQDKVSTEDTKMTPAQENLLGDFGPFELHENIIRDVNDMALWQILIKPPIMAIDHALVAALNHIVAKVQRRQASEAK